jgi:hypothetical protein
VIIFDCSSNSSRAFQGFLKGFLWSLKTTAPGQGKSVGAHAFSRDALVWAVSKTNPYTTLVNFSNGSSFDMRRRERPQLLLSERGQPRFFSTGVEDFGDHTWTLVMKVNAQ